MLLPIKEKPGFQEETGLDESAFTPAFASEHSKPGFWA
jgi:hypothetical protein